MSKEIMKKETTNKDLLSNYSNDQLEVLRSQIAKNSTDPELKSFLLLCKAKQLDPFSRQIFFVKRGEQSTIQIGIDGYRAIAAKTKALAGIDDPVYDTESATHPNKATVTVYRIVKSQKIAFTATARWNEYCPSGNLAFMWNKMPYHMLGKVAEALALRKAFPDVMGDLYTDDEMAAQDGNMAQKHDGGNAVTTTIDITPKNLISTSNMNKIIELATKKGKTISKILEAYKTTNIEDLTEELGNKIIKQLEILPELKVEEITPKKESESVFEIMQENIVDEPVKEVIKATKKSSIDEVVYSIDDVE